MSRVSIELHSGTRKPTMTLQVALWADKSEKVKMFRKIHVQYIYGSEKVDTPWITRRN